MPLVSDLKLNYSKFDPDKASQRTTSFVNGHRRLEAEGNRILDKVQDPASIAQERSARRRGFKKKISSGVSFSLTIAGQSIPVRKFEPPCQPKGIFMHAHGGGWVLNDEDSHDEHLKMIADKCGMIVLSVGYRLAPEHPHPCGANDCANVASHLVEKGRERFGADLAFIGGESAGAHLALLAYLHLRNKKQACSIRGLCLSFGCYDLSYLPYLRNPTPPQSQFAETMKWYTCRLFDGKSPRDEEQTLEKRREPSISPLYADWRDHDDAGKLPPALFMCGSDDPLVNDSTFMAAIWQMAGGNGVLRVHNGGWHGYIFHREEDSELVGIAKGEMTAFVREAMDGVYDV